MAPPRSPAIWTSANTLTWIGTRSSCVGMTTGSRALTTASAMSRRSPFTSWGRTSGGTKTNTRWLAPSTRSFTCIAGETPIATAVTAGFHGTKPGSSSQPDKYAYDPDMPVPSVGGNNCCGTPTPSGPRDQKEVESRHDVLVYTSDFLEEEVEVTGPVRVVRYASSDAVDTDFVAKLVDVYPDGKAYNMAEGILRARYWQGLDKPELDPPPSIRSDDPRHHLSGAPGPPLGGVEPVCGSCLY